MSRKLMSTALSNQSSGGACGRDAALAAMAGLHGVKPTLALLFVSHRHPVDVLRGVRSVLGETIPLIGTTSAGEYTHAGYVDSGAGLALFTHDHIRFHPFGQPRRWLHQGAFLGTLQGNSEAGLKSPFYHRTLMLFPDDASSGLHDLVERAMHETAMLYDIIGGPSPTLPAPPRPPALFYNARMFRSGLTGVEMLSRQPIGAALANGWTRLSTPYRVTRVEARRLVQLDGRPTREVYEDFAVPHRVSISSGLPDDIGMKYPIGVCVQDGDCRVSLGMGFDGDGAMRMTSPPAHGSIVYILGTEIDGLVEAARRAVRRAQAALGQASPSGALIIDCMSTAMLLEDVYQQQRAAVESEMGDVPFLGFRSHGVLARLHGQLSGHYECSVGACILPA